MFEDKRKLNKIGMIVMVVVMLLVTTILFAIYTAIEKKRAEKLDAKPIDETILAEEDYLTPEEVAKYTSQFRATEEIADLPDDGVKSTTRSDVYDATEDMYGYDIGNVVFTFSDGRYLNTTRNEFVTSDNLTVVKGNFHNNANSTYATVFYPEFNNPTFDYYLETLNALDTYYEEHKDNVLPFVKYYYKLKEDPENNFILDTRDIENVKQIQLPTPYVALNEETEWGVFTEEDVLMDDYRVEPFTSEGAGVVSDYNGDTFVFMRQDFTGASEQEASYLIYYPDDATFFIIKFIRGNDFISNLDFSWYRYTPRESGTYYVDKIKDNITLSIQQYELAGGKKYTIGKDTIPHDTYAIFLYTDVYTESNKFKILDANGNVVKEVYFYEDYNELTDETSIVPSDIEADTLDHAVYTLKLTDGMSIIVPEDMDCTLITYRE